MLVCGNENTAVNEENEKDNTNENIEEINQIALVIWKIKDVLLKY